MPKISYISGILADGNPKKRPNKNQTSNKKHILGSLGFFKCPNNKVTKSEVSDKTDLRLTNIIQGVESWIFQSSRKSGSRATQNMVQTLFKQGVGMLPKIRHSRSMYFGPN